MRATLRAQHGPLFSARPAGGRPQAYTAAQRAAALFRKKRNA
jgi:hypothetical protein